MPQLLSIFHLPERPARPGYISHSLPASICLRRFGFNNGQTSMDGLWAGGSAYNTDYMWVIYQLQLLGFNAIRVPYLFK
jgi:hypothetical protein